MQEFVELERLSLVSKVSSEIKNHTGMSDKTLTEYVLDQHKKAKSFQDFKNMFGSTFPLSLLESINRLVGTLEPGKTPAPLPAEKTVNGLSELESLAPSSKPSLNVNGKRKRDEDNDLRPRRGNYESHRPKDSRGSERARSQYDNRHSNGGSHRQKYEPPISTTDSRHYKERGRFSSPPRRQSPPPPSPPRRKNDPRASLDSFELQQLVASGAMSASEVQEIEKLRKEDTVLNGELEEEDVDIEVRDEQPAFLSTYEKQALELSPIRITKAPEGSLMRAAAQSDVQARERRELKQQEARDKAAQEAGRVDVSASWNDPMARPEQRQFASDLHNRRSGEQEPSVSDWKQKTQRKEMGMPNTMSIKDQRAGLPVAKLRKFFLDAVKANQVLVVVGQTGSGKTTQLPQFLAEEGYGNKGMIGVTQPRRVAAISVSQRVAEEVGCKLGNEVGYTIRFEDHTSPDTTIKLMTDGILLREAMRDPLLSSYSVIMLDEAHERSVPTDVNFGLIKQILGKRPDLKVIVTSATLAADEFSDYWNHAPVFSIPGRNYPVEIMYSRQPEPDYLDSALTTTLELHLTEPPGDILLFLTGKEEIDTACEILFERMKALKGVPELIILPIYSALPSEIQAQVWEPTPPGARKVICATNIAETSVTLPNITLVIDSGFTKMSIYDSRLGMDRLQVVPISRSMAAQRAGRAGRVAPGKCLRLYTEAAFMNEMTEGSPPEIQRTHLTSTLLQLKAMGINDVLHFDLMSPPPTAAILHALEELYALSLLDDEGLLTRLGRTCADFPIDPTLAKTLVASSSLKCSAETLTIISMITSQSEIFSRPRAAQNQADQKKAKFHDPTGDHLTFLNVYNAWLRTGCDFAWCRDNFIQARSLRRARDIREQLDQIMRRHRLPLLSAYGPGAAASSSASGKAVLQAFCAGFFRNTARKDPHEGGFKTLVEQTPVALHPSSALAGRRAEHVLYQSLIETSREWMHVVSAVEPGWLLAAAPAFFKQAPGDRLSKRRREERIRPLHNRFAGEDEWRLSAQRRQGRGGGGGTWG